MGNDALKVGFITVTPEMATEWLLKNTPNNRKVKMDRVAKYAEDMKSGHWVSDNLDPIVFNQEGLLENGQHRLMAVVRAGIPIKLFVIQNARSAMGTYDRGVPRSANDALKIRNNIEAEKRTTMHLACANAVLRDLGVRLPTDFLLESFLIKYQDDLSASISASGRKRDGYGTICRKASITKIMFYALVDGIADAETLNNFCAIVNSGFTTSAKESAAIVFRNQLMESQSSYGYTSSSWKRNSCIDVLTALALQDFVKGIDRRKKYNANSGKLPSFIERAKRKLQSEMKG